MIATRQSYGEALAELGEENKNIVVLDADLSSATTTSYSAISNEEFSDLEYKIFKKAFYLYLFKIIFFYFLKFLYFKIS